MLKRILLSSVLLLLSSVAYAQTPSINHQTLNLQKLIGKKYVLAPVAFPTKILFNLELANHYQLLQPSQSSIRIFNQNKELIDKEKITSNHTEILNHFSPEGDLIYIEAKIYYCLHATNGLCLIKNVVFEQPFIKGEATNKALLIKYELPSEKYHVESKIH